MDGPISVKGMQSVAGLIALMLLSTSLVGCHGRSTPQPTAKESPQEVQIDLGTENPPETKRNSASSPSSAPPKAAPKSRSSRQESLSQDQPARAGAGRSPGKARENTATIERRPAETPSAPASPAKPGEERVPEYTAKAVTPLDQSEAKDDLELTRRIRRALVEDEALSLAGKNIQIVTTNGRVVLQGRVPTEQERQRIVQRAQDLAGPRLESRLEVVTSR